MKHRAVDCAWEVVAFQEELRKAQEHVARIKGNLDEAKRKLIATMGNGKTRAFIRGEIARHPEVAIVTTTSNDYEVNVQHHVDRTQLVDDG